MALLLSKRLVVVVASASVLAGCADYMNRRDTVALGAGDAMQANTAIQVISAWPPAANDTNLIDDN